MADIDSKVYVDIAVSIAAIDERIARLERLAPTVARLVEVVETLHATIADLVCVSGVLAEAMDRVVDEAGAEAADV